MRLKNFLLVVEDIQCSKLFYKQLFGLDVITDFGTNVILTGGLVLQQREDWEPLVGQKVIYGGHSAELYFETTDMAGFLHKVQNAEQEIRWLNPPAEYLSEDKSREDGDRQVVRLYDPDGHVIEVAGY